MNNFKGGLVKMKKEDKNKEFDNMYEKYQKEVEIWSGGLIQTNKADFLKQYAFFSTVLNPIITEYVEAYLRK
jgi:hypothetical protein